MAVRVLTIFESGPTATGAAAKRLHSSLPAATVTVRGIDLTPSAVGHADGTIRPIPFRYGFDLSSLRKEWREFRSFAPDLVHAFGPLAVRVATFLRPKRLVVSHADRVDPFSRWLVRRADAVLAFTPAERARYERGGVRRNRLFEVPFGIDPPEIDRDAVRRDIGLSPDDRIIVASGQFDPNAGLRYAVWAFDLVRLIHPESRLVLIGDGPERPRVERFARTLGCNPCVRFVGRRGDAPRIVASADFCWLTHREGGLTGAHEALATGVPVMGFRTVDSKCLPVSADSLVPYGDPAALSVLTSRHISRPMPVKPLAIPSSTLAAAVAGVYDRFVARRTEG